MPHDDPDAVRARRRAEQRSEGAWYKLKEGPNTFRVLPTPKSSTTPAKFIEYAQHHEVGPKKATVRCGKSVPDRKGACWLCDVKIPQLKKAGKAVRAKALEPKDVLLIQVAKVDPDTGKMAGPKLFSPSPRVGDAILASILGNRRRDYTSAEKGYNVTITRTGTTKNDTRYGMLEPDEEPTKVPASIIEKLLPFSDLKEVNVYSEAKQKAAYTGADAAPDDDDEQEEAESPRAAARRVRDEEEPAEDGEPAEDDEQDDAAEYDEEEPPADDAAEEVEAEDAELVDEGEEYEEPAPPPRRTPAKAPAKAAAKPQRRPVVEEEPEEELEDDAVEADEAAEDVADEAEDDFADLDLDSIEDEPEEEAPPPRKVAAPARKPAPAPAKPAARPAPAQTKAAAPAPKKGLPPKRR